MAEPLTILQAILLGVVQGLTEWLPVSSSGHLVLAQHVLGVEVPVFFDLFLHLGTLGVVVVFFRATLLEIARALAAIPAAWRAQRSWRRVLWEDPARRLALLVVVGSVPTAVVGFAFEAQIVALFDSPAAVGAALVATGTFLWTTRWARPRRGDLGWQHALVVGLAQGIAILPGVSRSGATIGAATLLGVERETAVRYSFLLSIPAIAGAALFQTSQAALADMAANLPAYLAGLAAAVAVGYAALFLLVLLVRRQMLHWFALYCWTLGALALAWTWAA